MSSYLDPISPDLVGFPENDVIEFLLWRSLGSTTLRLLVALAAAANSLCSSSSNEIVKLEYTHKKLTNHFS